MTSLTRKNKTYTKQFKKETVALVTEQGYTVIEAVEVIVTTMRLSSDSLVA